MGLVTKLISGDHLRKSRVHDEKGNFAGWSNIYCHFPPAAMTGLARVLLGYRPVLPWIAYTSIARLRSFLTRRSRVLEYGSGMSTVWYARHAGAVYSVEDDRPWFEKVRQIIQSERLVNVTYCFAQTEEEYASFMAGDAEGFDLIMVDGSCRSKCVAHAGNLLRPGGILYLDNSDKDSAPEGGDMRQAEAIARQIARDKGAQIIEVTDFAPTQFFVQQGMCVKLPS
jgi:SAM-dependent methyltransferase